MNTLWNVNRGNEVLSKKNKYSFRKPKKCNFLVSDVIEMVSSIHQVNNFGNINYSIKLQALSSQFVHT